MVIIITGDIGIGKTTVCRKLIKAIRNQGYVCGGILTYKAADKDIIVEDVQSGEKETLASMNHVYHGPRTTKYYFNPKGINFGIQAIDKGTSAAIVIIDEIGYLELRGEGFAEVVELIRSKKIGKCIVVIRKELLSGFLSQLDTKPLLFETTIDNRDQLPGDIESVLQRY